tara:strand:+ start:858 stop:1031 length:174 start_codon:yes stop_codon:yes gene_type:complete
MYELQKTICILVLSTPLLYGVDHLARRVSTYDYEENTVITSKATHKQAYHQGAYPFY